MASTEDYPDDDRAGDGDGDNRDSRERSRDRDRRRSRSRDRRRRSDRDRDRRRRRRSSRSRSRDRSRDRSRSRSASKKRKEKKSSNWDQGPGSSAAGGQAVDPFAAAMAHRMHHNPKKARTVFVGGVTPEMNADVIRSFFEERLIVVPDRPRIPGPAVETVDVKMDKMYAFVEFHHAIDADIAMCMDGIRIGNNQISVRRPSNYVPPPNQEVKKWNISGVLSTQVPDGPNKIFLGNLPATMTEHEVQQLATAFGDLSAFTLSKDRNTGLSKGYAFFCYKDPSITNIACAGLNGQEIGGKRIACKPANQKTGLSNEPTAASLQGGMLNPMLGVNPMMGMGMGMGMGMMGMQMGMMGMNPGLGDMGMAQMPQTRCLIMDNMVTAEELADAEEYDDIMQDIKEELSNYGTVLKLAIPRPPPGNVNPQRAQQMMEDVGKIFVLYENPLAASKAFQALNGRKFSERTIVMTFMPEHAFEAKKF